MTLWCKKKNHYPPRWICITHIWSPTLFPRGIIIFQGVLTKLNFLIKFSILEKFVNLILGRTKNMNTTAFFPSGEGSNLILGISMENQIFFLRTPPTVIFSPNCHKMTLWHHWGGICQCPL